MDGAAAQTWAQSHGLEYHETSAVSRNIFIIVFINIIIIIISELNLSVFVFIWQKEIGQFEAPFLSLARAFHSLYQDQTQIIQSLV